MTLKSSLPANTAHFCLSAPMNLSWTRTGTSQQVPGDSDKDGTSQDCQWQPVRRLTLNTPTSINTSLFTSHFLQLYCPNGISPMGNSGCLPWGKPAGTESRYPTYGACWVFYCFHNPLNSDMDYGIFNVRTDVNACACTWGCMDAVRESALKVDSGRKIPCCTRESNLCWERACPLLYQLNYIPISTSAILIRYIRNVTLALIM